jgi:probable HAF family extracellular repeat protein
MGNSIKEAINVMKPKKIFNIILAVLFVFPLMGTFAQQAANSGSIEVITTFDYPGTGNSTLPQKINETGDVVGEFIDSNGVTRAFVRFSDGSFSDPIVDPNDTVGFTEGRGINNSRTICGDYASSDGNNHGFFLSGGTFTEYDVPGAVSTSVLGINDVADFTGSFSYGSGIFQGYVSVGGTITSFSVPGALLTLAYEINNSKQLVVGYYIDGSGILHGYYRDASGALHFPIDPSGSVATVLFGLNDRNWVVGRYADAAGATHGLFFLPPNSFFTFDYPGSTFTSLNGINDQGNICGRYVDATGIAHGFIARVRGTPPTQQMGKLATPIHPPLLAAPLNQSPSAWGGAIPAR